MAALGRVLQERVTPSVTQTLCDPASGHASWALPGSVPSALCLHIHACRSGPPCQTCPACSMDCTGLPNIRHLLKT